jgi:hexosaminidase
MFALFFLFCFVCLFKTINSQNIPLKSYTCNNKGSCELNDSNNNNGLSHGSCLISCGKGMLWPYPNSVNIENGQFTEFDFNNLSYLNSFKISNNNNVKFIELQKYAIDNFIYIIDKMNPKKSNNNNNNIKQIIINIDIKDSNCLSASIDNDESYSLKIETTTDLIHVYIQSETFYGSRHGLETLSQLIAYDNINKSMVITSKVSIEDSPSFKYRGVMIDVSRNYLSVSKIKETLLAMSYNKMNVLHIHMSDTASFPFVMKSAINMTSYGAYSEDEIYEVSTVESLVKFSNYLGIMILPEVDTPAHCSAGWQFGPDAGLGDLVLCSDYTSSNTGSWETDSLEPPSGQLNLANENIYSILSLIYEDTISMFDYNGYFHLGGDEVLVGSDEAWASCYNSTKLAQPILNYLTELGLSRNDESSFYTLLDTFTDRATKMIKNIYNKIDKPLNKIQIWGGGGVDPDGVTYNLMERPNLKEVLPPSLFNIQVWDASNDSIIPRLINQGYDVILSNQDYVYLDCGGPGYNNPGGYWCQPYHEWFHIYDYVNDIVASWQLNDDQLSHVMGSEVLLWSEMIDDINLSQKLWPRGAALAESLWSYNPTTRSNTWYDADPRMQQWRNTLVKRGINAEPLQPQWCQQRGTYACTVDTGIPQ